MKTNSILKSLFKGTAIIAIAAMVSSCSKDDDIDSSGSANLKVVNASSTSSDQSFYLASKAVVQGSLSYGDASDYIVTNSGKNLHAEFRNEGSATAYATGEFDLDKGANYSVFLAGDGQSARVKLYKDDLSAAASGQAKIRFIHLSDAAPANIDIKNGSGENIVANLGRDAASSYINVAPGILSLSVYAAGSATSLANFNLTAFAAGKIYTVYITGSTAQTISVQQIVHN